ncbi:MAG: Flp pilus assembly complex ATPase component TadA [Phycisphaeraceae bacterium]|nr:Flp pilus assembly complex ATPase component TadA [Phycisphaeraceae bacterium]
MPFLFIQTTENRRLLQLPLHKTTIGRSNTNTVTIEEDFSSRVHCTIQLVDGRYILQDNGSRNGTKMNGQPIASPINLSQQATFQIGQTRFTFSVNDPRLDPNWLSRPTWVVPQPAHAMPSDPSQVFNAQNQAHLENDSQAIADDPLLDDEADLEDNVLFDPNAQSHLTDPFAVLRRFIKPHRARLNFQVNQIGLVNSRGVHLHPTALAQSEQELTEQIDSKQASDENVGQAVNLFRLLLLAAFAGRASDIHFEPGSEHLHIRLRVDGSMVSLVQAHSLLGARLYGLIKVLSEIDISKRSNVQEGHFRTQLPDRIVDFRVSFTPVIHGQKLVIRVLDSESAPQHLDDLQLPDWMLSHVRKVSTQSTGMILVCGPTGSGKTTTLYAALRDIDVQRRNVITIEDPVEYQLEGVTQIPINSKQGNTFHSMLRSVLRQDPDVILLGEIRDRETAETGMQAAMTGHLVLSTIHAKDSVGTIFRLLDLGAEPYLVGSSMNLVLAQRLIRLLCPNCKAGRRPTPKQMHQMGSFGKNIGEIYYPVGCPQCFDQGYIGRQGLYELLTMTDELRDAILKSATMGAINDALSRVLFTSLEQSGYKLISDGITSPEELDRIVGSSSA